MTYDDDIFTAALTPKGANQSRAGIATLQGGGRSDFSGSSIVPKPVVTPTRKPVTRKAASASPADTPLDTNIGGGSDIWALLESEYGKVDEAFSTEAFDKAAEAEYGNIQTMADQSANAAAADYANRARQAGGSGEAAGLIKAEGLVAGRRTVADARMKQLQYDIQQKEAARNLAADIAGKIGGLREGYLENLTRYQIAQLQSRTQEDIAKQEAAWRAAQTGLGYAQLGEQSKEFGWLHPFSPSSPPGASTFSSSGFMPGWGGPGSAYAPYPQSYGINTSTYRRW